MEGQHTIKLRDGTIVTIDVDEDGGIPVRLRDGTLVSLILTELA